MEGIQGLADDHIVSPGIVFPFNTYKELVELFGKTFLFSFFEYIFDVGYLGCGSPSEEFELTANAQ